MCARGKRKCSRAPVKRAGRISDAKYRKKERDQRTSARLYRRRDASKSAPNPACSSLLHECMSTGGRCTRTVAGREGRGRGRATRRVFEETTLCALAGAEEPQDARTHQGRHAARLGIYRIRPPTSMHPPAYAARHRRFFRPSSLVCACPGAGQGGAPQPTLISSAASTSTVCAHQDRTSRLCASSVTLGSRSPSTPSCCIPMREPQVRQV